MTGQIPYTMRATKHLLLIMLSALILPSALAITTDTININSSRLPHTGSFPLEVTLTKDATLFIQRQDSETRINATFPSSVFYGESTVKTINFTYTIKDEFFQDDTASILFTISSTANNNTMLYSIIANVKYDENVYVTEDPRFFVNLLNGDFVINISTDLLPKSGTLKYEVAGLKGKSLNITCQKSWITCPKSATFGNNNKTSFDVKYTIPLTTEPGIYTFKMNLTSGNVTKNSSVRFIVKEPDFRIKEFVFTEDCFKESATGELLATVECMEDFREYNLKMMGQLISELRKVGNKTEYCASEIEARWYFVGNISESLWGLIDSCRDDLTKTRNEYNICRKERNQFSADLTSKSQEFEQCQVNLYENNTICLAAAVEKAANETRVARTERELTEEAGKKAVKKVLWIEALSVLGIGILIFIAWWLYQYKNNFWWS